MTCRCCILYVSLPHSAPSYLRSLRTAIFWISKVERRPSRLNSDDLKSSQVKFRSLHERVERFWGGLSWKKRLKCNHLSSEDYFDNINANIIIMFIQ